MQPIAFSQRAESPNITLVAAKIILTGVLITQLCGNYFLPAHLATHPAAISRQIYAQSDIYEKREHNLCGSSCVRAGERTRATETEAEKKGISLRV